MVMAGNEALNQMRAGLLAAGIVTEIEGRCTGIRPSACSARSQSRGRSRVNTAENSIASRTTRMSCYSRSEPRSPKSPNGSKDSGASNAQPQGRVSFNLQPARLEDEAGSEQPAGLEDAPRRDETSTVIEVPARLALARSPSTTRTESSIPVRAAVHETPQDSATQVASVWIAAAVDDAEDTSSPTAFRVEQNAEATITI